MRRLFDALLLKGLWKFKPIHVIAFWCFMAYQGWMASPYFMYYVVGAPEPGTAPRYVGTLHIEGKLSASRNGFIPPRYYIRTASEEIEFHCEYRPKKSECFLSDGNYRMYGDKKIEIGYDPYWGLDFFRHPPEFAHLDVYWSKDLVNQGRILSLKHHRGYLIMLCFGLMLYFLLVMVYPIWMRPRKPSDAPTEAEIAEALLLDEAKQQSSKSVSQK